MTDNAADTENDHDAKLLPGIPEILLEKSLYDRLPVGGGDEATMAKLREENFKLDAYCITCQDRSIFSTLRPVSVKSPPSLGSIRSAAKASTAMAPGSFTCEISCVRCNRPYRYYFFKAKGVLIKIGQYPSVEDVGSSDLAKYRNTISDDDYSELKRAGGLYSHGIGIGSFVYLRRIFERLIQSHHQLLVSDGKAVEDFDKMRMDEKIKALAAVLPPALVENRKVYGILSAGVHALNEADCRRYFPVVREAILQILDQDVAAKEAKAAAERLKAEVARIADHLNRAK